MARTANCCARQQTYGLNQIRESSPTDEGEIAVANVDLPKDVLEALQATVAWLESDDNDIDSVIEKDLPVIADWLRAQGLLAPIA
jgi:hypothetical protein